MRKRFLERLETLRTMQTGITLIELLVAIMIISILAAVATNYYYHQRRKAWVAQVHSSLRHMVEAENNFLYGLGAPAYSADLDDLYASGYRWGTDSVIPYVALATNTTFCIQVHSAYDPSIVWHFSSDIGRPQQGPATPMDCGDPEGFGAYLSGPPDATYGRDGQLSSLAGGGGGNGTTIVADGEGSSSGREGDGFSDDPVTGDGSSYDSDEWGDSGTGVSVGTSGTSTGSIGGFGTSDTTSGTDADPDTVGTTTPTCDGGTTGGSSGVSNHPSGKDRDTESGGSGTQGDSRSDPDGDENGGADKPGEDGGANTGDQDGNNGSGNDTDFEDDNQGPDQDGTGTPGTNC